MLPASAVHISDEAEYIRLFNRENEYEGRAEPQLPFEIAHILAQELIQNERKEERLVPSSKFTASVVPWPEAPQPWPIFVIMNGGTVCDFYPENWVFQAK